MVEDSAGGIEGFEGLCGGVLALGLRVRVGLMDLRSGSGEAGVGVLDLRGSSTMYISVSMSRNSTQGRSIRRPAQQRGGTHQKALVDLQ